MQKVIVTGANSFIGSKVVEQLINDGIEVIAIIHSKSSSMKRLENIMHRMKVVYVSLAEIALLKDLIKEDVDTFYHFAWAGSVGAARTDLAVQLKNVQWTIDCLHTAKAIGCKRFIVAGTIMEREAFAGAYAQGNQPGPAYIYGAGKLAAHIVSMSIAAEIGIDLIWTEITNVYGPGETSPRFINTTIKKILRGEPLQFTAATQNYDFVYITDAARAFLQIGKYGKPFRHYIIGSSHARPLKEFILEIQQALAPDHIFLFGDIPFTGVNLPLEDFDCSLTEKDTEFRAQVPFYEGLKETMHWLKNAL